jgi:hypothetical protein
LYSDAWRDQHLVILNFVVMLKAAPKLGLNDDNKFDASEELQPKFMETNHGCSRRRPPSWSSRGCRIKGWQRKFSYMDWHGRHKRSAWRHKKFSYMDWHWMMIKNRNLPLGSRKA